MLTVKGTIKRTGKACALIVFFASAHASANGTVDQIIQTIGEIDSYVALKTGYAAVETKITLSGEKETLKGSAPNISIHFGYNATRRLRLEVSYTVLGKIEGTIGGYEIDLGLGGGWEPLIIETEQEISLALLSAFYDFTIEKRLKPYIGAYIGYTINEGKVVLIAPQSNLRQQDLAPAEVTLTYGAAAGVRYDIGKGFRLEGGLSYTYTDYDKGQSVISGQIGISMDF